MVETERFANEFWKSNSGVRALATHVVQVEPHNVDIGVSRVIGSVGIVPRTGVHVPIDEEVFPGNFSKRNYFVSEALRPELLLNLRGPNKI